MRATTIQIVISGEKSNQSTLENIQTSSELESVLEDGGYTYRRAVGRYRGVQETSYMVTIYSAADVHRLLGIAAEFGQESILEINQGHGWLLFTGGEEEYLGSIYEASGREESYTQVGSKLFTFRREVS